MEESEKRPYVLYLHPRQKRRGKVGGRVNGYELEKHLRKEGILERACSLNSKIVKGWIANPGTYPEELKTKEILLWGRFRFNIYWREVQYLCWLGSIIIVQHRSLHDNFISVQPALLEPVS
ncbi:MAG: hypothetical protein Q8O98_01470 [bacterium]|nr:hypothetical protein [bacterium]